MSFFKITLISTACLFAPSAFADSGLIVNPDNNHIYQRIDTNLTWSEARINCINKGAHLVTITSADEFAFVLQNLGLSYYGYYYIGIGSSTDAWITGEPITYAPFTAEAYSYIYRKERWGGSNGGTNGNYSVCEWSSPAYNYSITVPDSDGNGAAEIASLGIDGTLTSYTIKIRDLFSKKVTKQIKIASISITSPVKGFGLVTSINANTTDDFAILYQPTTEVAPAVALIESNTGNTIKTINFLTVDFLAKSIIVTPDEDGSGFNEITVIGVSKKTGAFRAEKRDSKTGKVITIMNL